MVMPACRAPHLVVGQADLLFGRLKTALDPPTQTGGSGHMTQRRASSIRRRVESQLVVLVQALADWHPAPPSRPNVVVDRRPYPSIAPRSHGPCGDRNNPRGSPQEHSDQRPDPDLSESQPDRLVAADGKHVGATLPLHPLLSLVLAAVDLITGEPRRWDADLDCLLEQLLGRPRLGAKDRSLWNTHLVVLFEIVGPLLRQVESPVEECRAVPRAVGKEDTNLGVLDPASGARELPRHPSGAGALLEELGFVDHEHSLGVADSFHNVIPQVVTDFIGVLVRPPHQVVNTVPVGLPDLLGILPGVLLLHRAEQAHEVVPHHLSGLVARESRRAVRNKRNQLKAPVVNILEPDASRGDPPWSYRDQLNRARW